MSTVISVNNNKGGVLKTTTSLGIASVLAKVHGKNVLIIDADSQSNISTAFGINAEDLKTTIYDLMTTDLENLSLKETKDLLDDAIIRDVYLGVSDEIFQKQKQINIAQNKINFLKSMKKISPKNEKKQQILEQDIKIIETEIQISKLVSDGGKISILPSNSELVYFEYTLLKEDIKDMSSRMKMIVDLIKKQEQFDYIIIDSPPTLSLMQSNILSSSDKVVIPLEMEYFSIKGLTKMIGIVSEFQKRNPKLQLAAILPTKVNPRAKLHKDVFKLLSATLKIRDDNSANVLLSLEEGIPVSIQDATSIGYKSKPVILTKNIDQLKDSDKVTKAYINLVEKII